MDVPLSGKRVRWCIAGAFLPSPSGRRFLLTDDFFSGPLGAAARDLRLLVPDRFGAGDASAYEISLGQLSAFQLSAVVSAIPDLRGLHRLLEVLSGVLPPDAEDTARLEDMLRTGRLSSDLAQALRGSRSAEETRRLARTLLEEALFATARDVLQHPTVARLESTWRGLLWLKEHCPPSSGLELEVLDVEPSALVETLERGLDVSPLERPDACFVVDAVEDAGTLRRLAELGEQASLPMVASVPLSWLGEGQQPATAQEARAREAWRELRAQECSRWLCAAANPVVMGAEQQGALRRQCFAGPALAVAALLSASFRDTRTFGRLTGPGSGTHAPAVWQPQGRSTVATEACLSLREQERLAAQGLAAVSGWWDSNAVLLAAAPTVYGGRDGTRLAGQLLTGRLVRLAQELAERLPPSASAEAISAAFARAAETFLPTGSGRDCQLDARVVSLGPGERGVQVRASFRPELAGTQVQLAFTLPLRG